MIKMIALAVAAMAIAGTAQAQTVPPGNLLGPSDGLRVTWPAAQASPDGLDAPTGYRVKAVNLTGAVVRSWDTAASDRALSLTSTMIPSGAFNVTVHPFNVAGEAAASNSAGPFGKATVPKTLTGVSAGVVAGGA